MLLAMRSIRVPSSATLLAIEICLFSGAVLGCAPWGALRAPRAPVFSRVIERSADRAYHTYRIPAIVATTRGTLLAFFEGRRAGASDAGDIDLLVARSGDEGRSWSAPRVVWDDGAHTCGNPCPVVDAQSGRVWLAMTCNRGDDHERAIMSGESRDVRHVFVTASDDDGRTWRAPRKISSEVRQPHFRWYATGPGNGIQLERGPKRGRLIFPANHSDHRDPARHPYRSHVFWSDDGGESWELGGIHEDKTNESAIVEREDGRLL